MPEDKARKRDVRARMAATGERYTTAARRLGGIPPAPPDPAYTDLIKDDPPLAEREWSTSARVRILSAYPGSTADDIWHQRERAPQPGEELTMMQSGRAGRPVDRSTWWTSTDIDGAAIVPAEHVLVREVTGVSAPTHRGAALTPDRAAGILGRGTDVWAGLGVLVIAGLFDFEVRAADGELLGLVERGGQGPNRDRLLQAREPVTYRVVIRPGVSEAWPAPPAVKYPPVFMPPDPVRAAAIERTRWGGAQG